MESYYRLQHVCSTHYAWWNKADTERQIFYDSTCTKYSE